MLGCAEAFKTSFGEVIRLVRVDTAEVVASLSDSGRPRSELGVVAPIEVMVGDHRIVVRSGCDLVMLEGVLRAVERARHLDGSHYCIPPGFVAMAIAYLDRRVSQLMSITGVDRVSSTSRSGNAGQRLAHAATGEHSDAGPRVHRDGADLKAAATINGRAARDTPPPATETKVSSCRE